jgi:AraC-like DNA-binding protein
VIAADIGKRWTLKVLATVVNRSPSYLNALFYRTTGLTIRQYTLFLRMTKAAAEIKGGVKITAVALVVGFRSRKNFYRQFKAWFGRNPTDLRGSGRSHGDS